MGNKKVIIKPKIITLPMQITKILKEYKNVKNYKQENNTMLVEMMIQPTYSSKVYEVQIEYKLDKKPIIRVKNISKDIKLPHTYSDNELCLYYSKHEEWTKYDYIGDTIIPWISEWLYFYEIWLVTNKWLGGGIHPE